MNRTKLNTLKKQLEVCKKDIYYAEERVLNAKRVFKGNREYLEELERKEIKLKKEILEDKGA